MKDLGSFIEYEFPEQQRLFSDVPQSDIMELNSCRAAIYHAIRCYGVSRVWIAKYQCDEVRDYLCSKGIEVFYYDMNLDFEPLFDGDCNSEDSAIVFSNYFGLLGDKHFLPLIRRFRNVIIDNAQALFYPPQTGCINCYSPRKFVAAPDGAYVIGENVNRFEYEEDRSSDTCQFLFMRQEYGCDMHAYSYKKQNDARIHADDIKRMSPLTRCMLSAVDYDAVIKKRKENYEYARSVFDRMNKFDLDQIADENCVPMGYPLLTDFEIIPTFHEYRIYQPRYWEYILDEAPKNNMEYQLAKYMALICIDQRYGREDIDYQYEVIKHARDKI